MFFRSCYGIVVHLDMIYFNVYMMMIIILWVFFFLFKINRNFSGPLGSHAMFILGILVGLHLDMVYLDV